MLTNNIDIADRLLNGQLGTVARILVNEVTQKPTIVYIKFDDENVTLHRKIGKKVMTRARVR